MHKTNPRISRLASRSIAALIAAAGTLAVASAASAATQDTNNAGAEGTQVEQVIVTAEREKAAAAAPVKASLVETQPESIMSTKIIQELTPAAGNWVQVLNLAPSISGIPNNSTGEGATLTLRGFTDGNFNMTYDGIAFGDTNGPTHHEASYFPGSTIGAVVVDRGPGAAGDLGQANYGGAIHFFSPAVSNVFGVDQQVTYGSYNTIQSVTSLNTGVLPSGGKLLLSFDGRNSSGELSETGEVDQNYLAKFIQPITDKGTLTLFSSVHYSRFYENDGSGPGETWQQEQLLGKDFSLTNNPNDEHYYKDNYEGKHTDLDYADFKYEFTPKTSVEDQLYTYSYSNKTLSANANTDLPGVNTGDELGAAAAAAGVKAGEAGEKATDLVGYNKLNQYRVYGDIVRLNQDVAMGPLGYGTLKVGGQVEWSDTKRDNLRIDLTDGFLPAYDINATYVPNGAAGKDNSYQKLQEDSDWQNYEVFADFYWHPIDGLTLTPGFKFVDFHLAENASAEKVTTPSGSLTEPFATSNVYSSPLYFFTANYKIRSDLAVYGQVATSFQYPDVAELDSSGSQIQNLQPEKTLTYQGGVVFSHGALAADADVYEIDATNTIEACTVDDPTPDSEFCNIGKARFNGVEGEVAYRFTQGLTLFANGGSNVSKQLAQAPDAATGIAGNAAQTIINAPRWTDAVGAIYSQGPWWMSVDYKQSGTYAVGNGNAQAPLGSKELFLSGYDTFDAAISYDFGKIKLKLQGFNLLDRRAITQFSGSTLYSAADTGYYTFQEGRDVELTVEAKF